MKPGIRLRRALWSAVIFLAPIGSAVAVRRMVHLVPIVVGSYHPPAVTSDPVPCSYCAWLALHGPGSAAIQFNDSRPPSSMASLQWSHFCYLRFCDRHFGPGDELGHAGDRRFQSGGGDDPVRLVLSIRAVQGVLAYPAPRNPAAPRVDDSHLFRWNRRGYHPPHHWHVLCHQPIFSPGAP